jgi:hypothetical protein
MNEKELNGEEPTESLFVVEGKRLNAVSEKTIDISAIRTLLQQKVEELRELHDRAGKVVKTTENLEFLPEATPYIPGVESSTLYKHDNATIERNAGFQDASQVPKMYQGQIDKDRENKAKEGKANPAIELGQERRTEPPLAGQVGMSPGTTISVIEAVIESSVCPTVTNGQQPEFKLEVSRDKMHSGGHYFPNESRPYRPGA